MNISVTGRHIDVGSALTTHVEDNLTDVVTKYFDKPIDAQVQFVKEGPMFKADISAHPGPRGLVVKAEGKAEDIYPAFDIALEHIAKQLRRYKRRLTDHHRNQSNENVLPALQYVIQPEPEEPEGEAHDAGDEPVIVAEMPAEIATLTVSEAVMRMDLGGHPVLMFQDRTTGRLNVVYRRNDGNIGWIDPKSAE